MKAANVLITTCSNPNTNKIYIEILTHVIQEQAWDTTSSTYHSNNYDDDADLIEAKINSLGLLQPLKVLPNFKAPSAWVRLRGDKNVYFRPWTTRPRWLSC